MNVSETDIAWLGGMLDGEGNLSCSVRKNENGASYLDVKVRVSGNDIRMIAKLGEIYKGLNLRFFYTLKNVSHEKHKTGLNIEVSRQGSTKKLLEIAKPYLFGKQHTAQAIIDIINYVQGIRGAGNGVRRNYAETEEFKRLYKAYRYEHKWYFDPSTTTRRAGELLSLDGIV